MTGGLGSTMTGGLGSTITAYWRKLPGGSCRRAIAKVGDGGLTPDVAYRCVLGRWVQQNT